jgi:hypothetical protein
MPQHAATATPASTSRSANLLAEASNPDTAPERLDALTRCSPAIRLVVAGNPNSPPATLARLARSKTRALRSAIAGNPNADLPTLLRCIPSDPLAFLGNPVLPFMQLDAPGLLQSLPLTAFAAIARHPQTPRGLLDALVQAAIADSDLTRTRILLFRDDLEATQVRTLLDRGYAGWDSHVIAHAPLRTLPDPHALVCIASAESWHRVTAPGLAILSRTRAMPEEVLLGICKRAHPHNRVAIARNPRTPAAVLQLLKADSHPQVIMALHANPSTPGPIRNEVAPMARSLEQLFAGQPTEIPLEDLARNRRLDVRAAVARHPDAPATVCERFAKAHSVLLRRLAAGHRNTPDRCLLALVREMRWDAINTSAIRMDQPVEPLRELVPSPRSVTLMALHQLIENRQRRNSQMPVPAERSRRQPKEPSDLESLPQGLVERTLAAAPNDALADYAAAPIAIPELLGPIGRNCSDEGTLQAVAGNPRTPADVLKALALHASARVRGEVACNPSLPAESLPPLLRDAACVARAVLHPSVTPTLRRNLCPHWSEFLHGLADHSATRHLIDTSWPGPRPLPDELCHLRIHLTAADLELLSRKPDVSRRALCSIAAHPNAGPELLRRLSLESHGEVQACVAANPATPLDVLDRYMTSAGVPAEVARAAAGNPSLPADRARLIESVLIERWSPGAVSCPTWNVTLSHPACPAKRLLRGADSQHFQLRALVAANPATPIEALQRLMQDGWLVVRELARATLKVKDALSRSLVVADRPTAA